MQPEILVFNQIEKQPSISHEFAEKVIIAICSDHALEPFDVNVITMGTKEHTDLNINYLGHEYATDVITFDLSDKQKNMGEVYINYDVANDNAQVYNASHEQELNRLLVHGVLHLVGMDDQTVEEREKMKKKEDHYLNRFM